MDRGYGRDELVTIGLSTLLAGGGLCLTGLGASCAWMLSEQKRHAVWRARRDATIGNHLRPKLGDGPALMRTARHMNSPAGILTKVHAIFGWREDRRGQYPATWSVVAVVSLGPAIVGSLLATRILGASGWLALPLLDVMLTRAFLVHCGNRASRELLVQFPDALSMVSRSVRIGTPLSEAVRVVARECLAPTRTEFGRVSDGVSIGIELETALREMADRNGLAEYRFFATALALQSQTGGGLTETLDTLADTIRKREAARKRGAALASEARTSIYFLTALPAVSGVMLWLSNPDYIGILFITAGGQKLLAIAVFMLLIGLGSMQQIIKKCLS